jgi:nucleotide-binding universal stress UspA family protein
MFRRILAALDNSEISNDVFAEALLLARASQASLLLFHVLSDIEAGYPACNLDNQIEQWSGYSEIHNLDDQLEQWEQYQQRGISQLKSHLEIATKAGVRAEIDQSAGAVPTTICDVAKSWHADLIVVGHQKLSGFQALFRGSVSNYVMHYAPCSVLTVQSQVPASLVS